MWRSAQALLDAEDRPAFGIWRRADIDPHTTPVRTWPKREHRTDPAHVNRAKTHCPRGHPYDETNTYHRPDRTARECLACRRERRARA